MKINKSKNQLITLAIIFFGLFGLAQASHAADFYIAQAAAGSGNGTSCANAKASSWNWSEVADGDTVYLCGNFSSTVNIPISGTSAGITLKSCKDGEANCGTGNAAFFSAPYWSTLSPAIMSYNNNHVIIDGNGVGTIQATANGDDLANQQDGGGIYVFGNNVEVKNWTIQNLYIKPYDNTPAAGSVSTVGIYLTNGSNDSAHDNIIHDAATGVEYNNVSSATQSNINLYNNTVYNCNWGVQAIGGGSNTLSNNVNIYSNDITIGANWLTTSGVYHSNGSYCFYVSGASVSNLNFYDNYVHGPSNPPGSWTASGFFWVSVDPGGLASGIAVYNNLMVGVSGNPANEYVGAAGTDAIVANNTIIGYQNGAWGISVGCPSGTCATVENNIVADTSIGLSFYGTNYKAVFHSNNNDLYNNSTLAIDYRIPEDLTYTDTTARDAYWSTNYPILVNDKTLILVGTQEKLWQGSTNPNSYNSAQWTNWQDTPVYYTALSSWQADQGGCPNSYNDCASVAGNPNLSASHVPNLDSLLIGAGANLTSLGITALNSDATGAARPATGAWDIGAYQYQTGSDTIAPNSPTGLSVE